MSAHAMCLCTRLLRQAGWEAMLGLPPPATLTQDAVAAGHLKSATYQRLLAGVIAKSALYLVAFALVSITPR